MKLHLLLVSVVVLAVVVATSCQSSRLLDTWVPSKNSPPTPFGRLMIVGLAASPSARAHYENAFVDKLRKHGVVSIASVNVVPRLKNIDRATVESWLTEFNLDGVIVTRVTTTKPPRNYVPPHLSLAGWYGAWGMESEVAPTKGKFYVETDLYHAKTEELRYSAVLQTKVGGDRRDPINAVIELLAEDMAKRGYFPGR